MKRKYLLLLTVCCSCLLAAFICSGCNNRDSSQKHTAVKNHTSAKETVKPYSDFKYADHFNRSNLSLTDRSMDSIDIDTFKSTFNEFHTALDSDGTIAKISEDLSKEFDLKNTFHQIFLPEAFCITENVISCYTKNGCLL